MSQRESYPPATAAPCNECPWRRVAAPGWLGPHTAMKWVEIIHGEEPIACHKTIKDVGEDGRGDWDHPAMRQCRGAAIFREHVMKSPRDPNIAMGPADPDKVFVTNAEFIAHHTGDDLTEWDVSQAMSRRRLFGEEEDDGA